MSRSDAGWILPDDEHNRTLSANVRPPAWVNPEPGGRYNLLVVGAGTAGLVTAAVAAGLGAKVALVEKHLMGGDCLNVGCVPSKAIIGSSRVLALMRRAEEFGLRGSEGAACDFAAVMARMRRLRAGLSGHDSAQRFADLGVDVFFGEGRFAGPARFDVGGKTLSFARAAICTGTRAASAPIPGLQACGYLTNETVFSLTTLPRRLAVIGAGPIGCELAQAFARFGSQVSLVEAQHGILPNEDRDAAEIVLKALLAEGVRLLCCGKDLKVHQADGGKRVTVDSHARRYDIDVDEILVGIGRTPNVEGLGLETVGVEYGQAGVTVNDRLQTTAPNIYAAGDVCSRYRFTHAADAMAQIVIQNALFPHPLGLGYASTDNLIIPWATYTDPEIAHVGLYETEAKAKGIEVDTLTVGLDKVDRAVLDGEDEGFARVHVKRGTDKVLGATIVAARAGDLIGGVGLLMKAGIGLRAVAGTIFPYPTQAEVLKKVAHVWRKGTLTQGKKDVLGKLFVWMRRA